MKKFLNLGLTPSLLEPSDIGFGEWLPDRADFNNPGSIEALNVIPFNGNYAPFRQLVRFEGATLPDNCFSGITVYSPLPVLGATVQVHTFLGSADGIYQLIYNPTPKTFSVNQGRNLAPEDNVSSYYPWGFSQFGVYLVAFHPEAVTCVADLRDPEPQIFVDLTGSPPQAVCGGRIGDFMVLGNLRNDLPGGPDGPQDIPHRIRWSPFDNIFAAWETDPATQSDFQDMPAEYGAVMAVTGREFGSVFQERAISRMTYVGLPGVFDIETVETQRGAISPGCVVDMGSLVYFIAEDGFFVWNGTDTTPIGDKRCSDYIRRKLYWRGRFRITAAVDRYHGTITWAIPNMGDIDDIYEDAYYARELFIYSYRDDKWSHANEVVQCIFSSVYPDATTPGLEDLDDDPQSENIDLDTLPLDAAYYTTQRAFLGAIDEYNRYGMFVGRPKEATIDTTEATAPRNNRMMIGSVVPLVDVDQFVCQAQVLVRDQLQGGFVATDSFLGQEENGEIPILAEGRYVRVRLRIPADTLWNTAHGFTIYRKELGRS